MTTVDWLVLAALVSGAILGASAMWVCMGWRANARRVRVTDQFCGDDESYRIPLGRQWP